MPIKKSQHLKHGDVMRDGRVVKRLGSDRGRIIIRFEDDRGEMNVSSDYKIWVESPPPKEKKEDVPEPGLFDEVLPPCPHGRSNALMCPRCQGL